MSNRTSRSDKKKREKKKASLIVTILVMVIFLSLCYGAYLMLMRTVRVSEITFRGNKYTKSRDLASLIRVRKGDELLSIPGGELYARLKTSPWVSDAVIRKRLTGLTGGRIEVLVHEAVPVAVLSRNGKPFLIDGKGSVLEELREGSFLFLPVIEEIDPVREKEAYKEAISCIQVLHKRRVLAYNGNVVVTGTRPEDIAIHLDNITVKIGAGDLEKKLERLAFVREEIQKRNMAVESIDLRFNGRIIVKPVVQEPQPVVQGAALQKPEPAKEAAKKREVRKPAAGKPDAKKPEAKKAETKKAEPKKTESKKAEAEKADTEIKKAVAKIAAAKKAEAKKDPKKQSKKAQKKQVKKEPEKRQQR
ncbi:MAG: FtsQ-type POTRA domain-containing protein [Thermodesulfovibrionales bacterium]|jgi:cell division septal protein FtsQ